MAISQHAAQSELPSSPISDRRTAANKSATSKAANLPGRIQDLLDRGQSAAALKAIQGCGSNTPDVQNAKGVCLMRLNRPDEALRIYRGLTLAGGGVWFRDDVPLLYRLNFATALALGKNPGGAIRILRDIEREPGADRPRVRELRAAMDAWEKSLPLWDRVQWKLGANLEAPVPIDFVPGELS